MPNYNYNRGRAREYQVIVSLRNLGWVCTRSAMSHGPVDIIAARKGRIRLIQVKSGTARVTAQELKLLKKWAKAFDADAEIWSFRERGKIVTEKVHMRSRQIRVKPAETGDMREEASIDVGHAVIASDRSLPILTPSLIS